jgi:hypothetical protein
MKYNEDWLQDPLLDYNNEIYKYHIIKTPKDGQQDKWKSFHYATRLKLEGSVYFLRQVLGATSLPDNLGSSPISYKQTKWYLGAFFFELMSAYDTMLQELNVVYVFDLQIEPENVKWSNTKKFLEQLPIPLLDKLKDERGKQWFIELTQYRNQATHHYYNPLSSSHSWAGSPTNFDSHEVNIISTDKNKKVTQKKLDIILKEYLSGMSSHIISVWDYMIPKFE